MACGLYTGLSDARIDACCKVVCLVRGSSTCRKSVLALDSIAEKRHDKPLTEQNKHAMSLTHGFAHGVCQSVLLCIR